MQASQAESDHLQILSRCLAIDNFDHKIITPSFDGANSPDVVCPVCQEQFQLGKM